MDSLVAAGAPWPGAVGVSGGSDSLALMHLLADWARSRRRKPPVVLTVDHGLRPDSKAAARKVALWARQARLQVEILVWKGKKPASDVEAAAREARYRLMADALAARGLGGLYVAHTRDDQAETFLLRLARGSGLDGLSAMQVHSAFPVLDRAALSLLRPLLGIARHDLRSHLAGRGAAWIEDPMNIDPRFARARIRAAWPALEAIGLGKERIADAALHLARAREALDHVTSAVLRSVCRLEGDVVVVDSTALAAAPREVALRALAQLLMAVGGQVYRPRFERLERLLDRMATGDIGGGCTLHGCRIARAPRRRAVFGNGTLLVGRESPRRS